MPGPTIVWFAIIAALVFLLGGTFIPGWLLAVLVAAAVPLGILDSVKQKRMELHFVRSWWQALTRR